MRKSLITTALLLAFCMSATTGFCDTKKGEKIDGKKEFETHCARCHPNGGSIVNKVKNTKDIIAKMRNPDPGMTKFDEKAISNKEAKAIAEYILKAFK